MEVSKGKVVGVNGNMVSVQVRGQVSLNEVAYLLMGDRRFKSEVIRIKEDRAELQVFEMTRGIAIGDTVEFTGELLSVELGPGLLGQVFDGLQNPLPKLAEQCGFFLDRGVYCEALSRKEKWSFTPKVSAGDSVEKADTLGIVPEGIFEHRIMVPFNFLETYRVISIAEAGEYGVDQEIAELEDHRGNRRKVTMSFSLACETGDQRLRRSPPSRRTHGDQAALGGYLLSLSLWEEPTASPAPSAPGKRFFSR